MDSNEIINLLTPAAIASEDKTDRFSAAELTDIASALDSVTAAFRREVEAAKAAQASKPATSTGRRPGARRPNYRPL
jgi:uncharacterized damage-inducible protein DinB